MRCRGRLDTPRNSAAAAPPPWMRRGARPLPAHRHSAGASSSQGPQEVDQILLLLLGIADAVAPVVEVDELAQRRRRAIGEIRRPRGEPAKLLHDNRADVVA